MSHPPTSLELASLPYNSNVGICRPPSFKKWEKSNSWSYAKCRYVPVGKRKTRQHHLGPTGPSPRFVPISPRGNLRRVATHTSRPSSSRVWSHVSWDVTPATRRGDGSTLALAWMNAAVQFRNTRYSWLQSRDWNLSFSLIETGPNLPATGRAEFRFKSTRAGQSQRSLPSLLVLLFFFVSLYLVL